MNSIPAIKDIEKMQEITKAAAEKYAQELFELGKIGHEIAKAAGRGESSLRIRQDRFIDLERTTYALGLVQKLTGWGYRIEFLPALHKVRELELINYTEMVITWGAGVDKHLHLEIPSFSNASSADYS